MSEPIVLTDEYVKAQLARAVPDAEYDRTKRAWVLDPDDCSPRSAMVALQLFPHLWLEHEWLEERRQMLIADVRPFDNATPFDTRIEAPVVEEHLHEEGKALYDFQAIDLGYHAAILREHGSSYLGWERGLGKTIGALSLIDALDARTVLGVVPNSSKVSVWEEAIDLYIAPKFDVILILPNTKKKREQCMELAQEAIRADRTVFLVVHYEALSIIAGKSGRGWDKYGEWDFIFADEVHRINNPKAKMTRSLKRIPGKRKLALSGSIFSKHVEELFSPLQWLYPNRYRAKWRDWNDRFLDYVEGGYGKIFVGILPEKVEDLRQEMGVIMTYRRKEDELDLPEKVEDTLFVDMTPHQRKVYDELVQSCVAQIEDDKYVAAADGLPMLVKLRQIATGLDLVAKEVADSSKFDVAVELLTDNPDEQFVVFSWFKATCDALRERVGEGVVIHGDVPQAKRDPLINSFKNGDQRILFATIYTMGEAQNFQNAANVIFIDRSWNPTDNEQAEDRVYRIGQERKVTITTIVARNTVDEHRVSPVLANKTAMRSLVLGGQ